MGWLPLYDFLSIFPIFPRVSYEFLGFIEIYYVLIDLVLVHVPCVVPLDY